jgi:hypothetical protein
MKLIKVVLSSCLLFGLSYAEDANGTNDKYSNRIGSYALSPYTKKSYPKWVEEYKSRLQELEKMRRKAAEMALDSGKCDYVSGVDLSTQSSLNNIILFIDCKNKERIYLNESEIKKNTKIRTQSEKSWSKDSAIKACEFEIKSRALIPSAVDIHNVTGTSYYKAPVTSNVVINMNFDAKNALGEVAKYKATCILIWLH